MSVKSIATFHHNVDDSYPAELKKEILEAIGNIDHIEVWGQQVLLASYIGPCKRAGGLIIPGEVGTEDRWQSKSTLILKMGVEALEVLQGKNTNDKFLARFNGKPPQVGDWVFHDVKECFHFDIRGTGFKEHRRADGQPQREWKSGWPVRLLMVSDIYGRTTRPQDIA